MNRAVKKLQELQDRLEVLGLAVKATELLQGGPVNYTFRRNSSVREAMALCTELKEVSKYLKHLNSFGKKTSKKTTTNKNPKQKASTDSRSYSTTYYDEATYGREWYGTTEDMIDQANGVRFRDQW